MGRTPTVHPATISRLLNNQAWRSFRVKGVGSGEVRVISLSRDSEEAEAALATRGYLTSRCDRNVFLVTGRTA